jgi:hypothetical protein
VQIQFTPTSAKLYFSYYGLDPNNGGKQSHADASGNLVLNTPSSKPTGAISNPAPSGPINFPMLNAARLYVSVGQPLLFAVNPAGAPIPPNPADPNDPNYGTQWDFYELTYIPQAGTTGLFNFNLSNVQSANLPLSFHVTGKDPSNKQPVDYTRGWLPGGFQKFLSYLGANTDFKQLVLPGTQRVLAPGTAITAYTQKIIPSPLFNADYLKDYIAQVWTKFASVDLTFVGDPPPNSNTFVTWTGRVQNGQFTFKTDFGHGLVPIVLNPPSTSDMFENNFLFCVSGCGDPGSLQQNYALQIFGTFCAAFNRSMMLLTTTLANSSDCEWCKAKDKFYQDPTTNHYAKSIHANCIDQLAYAFQSDDHCDTSSYVSLIDAPMVTVTLNP